MQSLFFIDLVSSKSSYTPAKIMSNNFITNNKQQKTLKGRLNTLISISEELKFLVGFFYFSGWTNIYEALQRNPEQKLKLLVGLQVCNVMGRIVEFDEGQIEAT